MRNLLKANPSFDSLRLLRTPFDSGHVFPSEPFVACHERALSSSKGESNGGGGGNRTPVRERYAKSNYMLSRRFNLAPEAPNGRLFRDHPV